MVKTLIFRHTPSQSITTNITARDADTLVGSAGRTTTEHTNAAGFYAVDVDDVAAGYYRFSADSGAATGYVYIGDADAVYHGCDDPLSAETLALANVAAADSGSSTAAVDGGIFSGSQVSLHQDDDYTGDTKLTFTITHPTRDYSGVDGGSFGFGGEPGAPDLEKTPAIVSKGVGSLVMTVEIPKADLQIDAGNYRYTLKAYTGTNRQTVDEGTVTVNATYVSFSS
ncbi:hypothetical protein [Roseiconus lacunae]|uniref:Uncharacterized protein n=1 Tax=Roseiconus lacunae TaxID=2605694 RepID=A0ABT7PH70_9BACT|nr:hypothetical protein [Roseiconus lacunae]MDM4015855.1 hypothetical protein [Roseiconus lacunae]